MREHRSNEALTLGQQPSPKPVKKATYKNGVSDGGHGKWQKEHTPEKGSAYQQKVTGAPRHTEYVVDAPHTKFGKIKFDGYDPERNVLIDAKDWDKWPPKGQKWADDVVVTEAKKQAKIFRQTGTKIEWYVPSQEKATQIKRILKKNNIIGIDIIPSLK